MYWSVDPGGREGGYWRCAVTKRERQRATDAARRDVKCQRQRERYDSDPIYRIEKRLRDAARTGEKLQIEATYSEFVSSALADVIDIEVTREAA
jgi:hypothetical protein